MPKMTRILPILVISQFFCTSVWFAGNAIMPDLARAYGIEPLFFAHLTSAIQFGFISGTLLFATLTLSDRLSPSKLFFVSSFLAALFNAGMSVEGVSIKGVLVLRFLTGFCLAGVYPVGMKIASDYYQSGLGKSLGFLVGALVLGTAFPHLAKDLTQHLPWRSVLFLTSSLAWIGGLLVFFFIPDGPFRQPSQGWLPSALFKGFQIPDFRAVTCGYFGHMWELYAFWAFLPIILTTYNNQFLNANLNVPLLSFGIIASGSLSCSMAGLLANRLGTQKLALGALSLSGLCCLLSPVFFNQSSSSVFLVFLFFWGLVVIADSPLFSTLVAQNAPVESRGTSLTVVNCIGFAITIVSIQVIRSISDHLIWPYTYMILGIGPILGILGLVRKKGKNPL